MALDDFNRRGFLRATGITMALPMLESIIILGTGMGDASAQCNNDLPLVIADGGFKHGAHVKNNKKHVFGDLFITIQNHLRIKTDSFKILLIKW